MVLPALLLLPAVCAGDQLLQAQIQPAMRGPGGSNPSPRGSLHVIRQRISSSGHQVCSDTKSLCAH